MVRLTVDRPLPDLATITRVLRNDTRVRLVFVQQERSPMDLLSAFSKAAKAHQQEAAQRRRLLQQQEEERKRRAAIMAEEERLQREVETRSSDSDSCSLSDGIVGDLAAAMEAEAGEALRQNAQQASVRDDDGSARAESGNLQLRDTGPADANVTDDSFPLTDRSPHSDVGYDGDADEDAETVVAARVDTDGTVARRRRGSSSSTCGSRDRRRGSTGSRGSRGSPTGKILARASASSPTYHAGSSLVAPRVEPRRLSSETTVKAALPPPNSVDIFEVVQCLEDAFDQNVTADDFLPLCMLDVCSSFFEVRICFRVTYQCLSRPTNQQSCGVNNLARRHSGLEATTSDVHLPPALVWCW